MILLLIIGATLLLTGIVLYSIYRTRDKNNETQAQSANADRRSGECCGQHAVCERDSLLAAAGSKIVYYDDEELDKWRGTPSNGYDETQTEVFRDIFYTMQSADVPGWIRSLQLRGIELPDEIKDEVLLVASELRNTPDKKRK